MNLMSHTMHLCCAFLLTLFLLCLYAYGYFLYLETDCHISILIAYRTPAFRSQHQFNRIQLRKDDSRILNDTLYYLSR